MSLKNAFSLSHFCDRHFLAFTFSATYQRPLFGRTQCAGFESTSLLQPKHRPSADRQRNLTEAQCVGLEPTRRTNARPDSNRLQFHYGNTAKFSVYRQEIGKETVSTFLLGYAHRWNRTTILQPCSHRLFSMESHRTVSHRP